MNLTLPSTDPPASSSESATISPYRFNGHAFLPHHLTHPLLTSARTTPSAIDTLLQHTDPSYSHASYLSSSRLPADLEHYICEYSTTLVTPDTQGIGIRTRPRWFYANCAVFGMLLGRAFALLSTPVRGPKSLDSATDFPFIKLPAELRIQIYEYYREDLVQRQRYWDVMTRIFIKALWSGPEPEEGARYITGMIVLTCGHSMSLVTPELVGHGSRYIWWDDTIKDLQHTWTFSDLRAAVFATRDLPRTNTDWRATVKRQLQASASTLGTTGNDNEFVSREVLEVYDLAREHLRGGERDWTPPEIEAKLVRGLFEREEARRIWEETGVVPKGFEGLSGDDNVDAWDDVFGGMLINSRAV